MTLQYRDGETPPIATGVVQTPLYRTHLRRRALTSNTGDPCEGPTGMPASPNPAVLDGAVLCASPLWLLLLLAAGLSHKPRCV